jgi:hypothetical protein
MGNFFYGGRVIADGWALSVSVWKQQEWGSFFRNIVFKALPRKTPVNNKHWLSHKVEKSYG